MRRGFTLVELLVTVSIIAILATIAIGAYNGLQKNGRDAKRQADLKVIQSALEQYKADQNYYPTTGSVVPGSSLTSSTGSARSYLNKIPKSPKGVEYSYFALPSQPACDNTTGKLCTSYYLCAKVENSNNRNTLTNCDNNYDYEVSSP